MKKNQQVENLLERYRTRQCTPEEVALIEHVHLTHFKNDGPHDPNDPQRDEIAKQEVWAVIVAKMAAQKPSMRSYFKYIATAAMVLIIATSGYFYYSKFRQSSKPTVQVVKVINDVEPGGNRAYLTLADGRRIALDSTANGALAQQAGMTVSKTDEGEVVYNASSSYPPNNPENPIFNTISTPRGGEYQVILPDGSKVWLNAASSVKFPVSFAGLRERELELRGEAYFDVVKNAKQPFIVKTPTQQVEVLGTQFNINSYTDEKEVKTTLLEGSVKISTELKSETILKPGQQAIHHQDKKIVVRPADETAVAWKKGLIKFSNADLQSIMRQISRWYDLEIRYEAPISSKRFNGGISRGSNLADVLKILAGTGISFKIEQHQEGKVLIVNN